MLVKDLVKYLLTQNQELPVIIMDEDTDDIKEEDIHKIPDAYGSHLEYSLWEAEAVFELEGSYCDKGGAQQKGKVIALYF